MPTITSRVNKLKGVTFQAKVRKAGRSFSKTFDSEAAALHWSKRIEDGLTKYQNNVSNNHRAIELAPLIGYIPTRVLEALIGVPYTLADILDASIEAENMIGIYFLIFKEKVIYVGQSKTDVLGRIAKHRRNGKVFDRFSYIQCETSQIDMLESMYIEAFLPNENSNIISKL